MIRPHHAILYVVGLSVFIGLLLFVIKASDIALLIFVVSLIAAGSVGLATWLLLASVAIVLEKRLENYMIWVAVISGLSSAFVGAYIMTTILEVTTK